MLINLILWIIFGGLIGWIASIIAGTNKEQGIVANVIVGIVGALIGGFIANALGSNGVTGFNFKSFAISVLGAVILLYVVKFFSRSKT